MLIMKEKLYYFCACIYLGFDDHLIFEAYTIHIFEGMFMMDIAWCILSSKPISFQRP
jgi:hypothetical protein